MAIKVENLGSFDDVVCDFCNADGEYSNGGILMNSWAICGKCVDKNGYVKDDGTLNMEHFKDEDGNYEDVTGVSILDTANTFAENIRRHRIKTTGSATVSNQFISFDTFDEMQKFLHPNNKENKSND